MEEHIIENYVLEKNLDRVLDLIKNCDTKVSYILAITGITCSILIKIKTPNLYFILNAISDDKLYWFFSIAILGLILASVFFLKGIYHLTQALMARSNVTEQNKDSMIFFGSIVSQNKDGVDYLNHIESSEYDYRKDLAHQIYINSSICTLKFENYVKGLKLIRWSLPLLIVIWSYLF